eukprot:TRINITY_DN11053_c0_g1_i1.p1 TRINITY_DN11053_c0_g1~~TRINITY_DN11053_c0_g1_i1.p1  ORF type:complete len:546 (-),score=180.34 TRINITY_DN11053_c0_g1_i1:115-1731(-)
MALERTLTRLNSTANLDLDSTSEEIKELWLNKQKKVFTRWVQNLLDERKLKVADLIEDLKDGFILCNLMEIISNEKLPFKFSASKGSRHERIQSLGTIQQLLPFMRSQGLKLTLGPEDIYDGKVTLVMGLIWTIILKYQDINKSALLEWVQSQLKPYTDHVEVKNFADSWQDGKAFAYLIHSLAPNAIDISQINKIDAHSLLEKAFAAADSSLHIPKLLDPEDLKAPVDERIVMTYVSYFRKLGKKEPSDLPPPKPTVVVDEDEIKRLRAEIERLKKLLEGKDLELFNVQQNNQQLLKKYGAEISYLLNAQKESQAQLEQMKKKVSAYSKKIMELSLLIKESAGNNNINLEDELNKLAILNEELQKKVAALEQQLEEANKKAQELYASLKSVDGNDPNLGEKLDDAIAEVSRLMKIKMDLLAELDDLKDKNREITTFMAWLNKQLKAQTAKTEVVVKKQKVIEEKQQLFTDTQSKVEEQLESLVAANMQKLENIREMLNQLKQAPKTATVTKKLETEEQEIEQITNEPAPKLPEVSDD